MANHRFATRLPVLAAVVGSWIFFGFATASAQTPEADASGAEAPAAGPPVDEIVVTRQRNMASLIDEAAQATEGFYMMLNDVLDNDRWRISCRNEYPAGSRIPRRVCTTRFFEDAMNRQASLAMQGFGTDDDGNPTFSGTIIDVQAEILREQRLFEDAILTAVNTSPALNAHVVRMMGLKENIETFETPRQQRRRERRERREGSGG